MENLFLPQPFLKAFPRPETVFADTIARYERLLNPLVSIELSAVDPELSGWIHLVSPIEPYDGLIGSTHKKYWGPFLQPNWIAFRVTAKGRYQLLGDFRFFEIEVAEAEGEQGHLQEYYDQQHRSFSAHKAAFTKTGQVCKVNPRSEPRPMAALSQLGGIAPVANMIWKDAPGSAFTYSDADAAPRTSDGRLYRFIAAAPGWHYRSAGADSILLYYDPVERIALETFVFT
jgi:hypothetical protein